MLSVDIVHREFQIHEPSECPGGYGAEEDLQGLPFVGRAGQLLTKMIESIKLSREDVYITNVLKCRPPNNRDPLPAEIEKCEPILLRQIELIKPRIICALGRIAGQTLLRTAATLGALRGKVHDYHGVKLVVTYPPADHGIPVGGGVVQSACDAGITAGGRVCVSAPYYVILP